MNFTVQDFINAGYTADYYNNLKYISYDEQSHVQLLTSALKAAGYPANAACSYKFPYTDVKSFITLSSVLEGVGTSAYLAGAPLITSKQYLTVAGSILVAEALHTSMQRSAVAEVPMANPYGTPLDPTSVYTLAAMFINNCPSTNTPLPFTPFPTLSYAANPACYCEEPDCSPSQQIKRDSSGACKAPTPGARINLNAASNIPSGSYVTFVSGLNVVSVVAVYNGSNAVVTIPKAASGQTYVFISKTDQEGTLDDSKVLFGPAIVEVGPAAPAIDYTVT